ncbi:MAG: MinD/ParA family protein [Phycisphaerae bacterium]
MGSGSLRSHRNDQATRLRELMRAGARRGSALAITSGKGGVGKSNLAVNLSICLAARGLRVTLVDVDMGLANADVLINLHPVHTLSHVLTGVRSLESICITGPGGIRFVPGASGRHDFANLSEFDRQSLVAQLGTLRASTDMLVFDCGAGISRNVIAFAQAADDVIVVTTPEPTAMTDAYATIKVLVQERYAGGMSLFVNMAESRAEAVAAYKRIASVAQRFLNYTVADAAYMLHDTAVELAVQERSPFVIRYPGANATAAVAALAGELSRSGHRQPGRGGFLRRVAGLFV